MNSYRDRIAKTLIDFGNANDPSELFPTAIPEAAVLTAEDPYAFFIAACLDRGTKTEIIWTIPYDIKKILGHLDPQKIYAMSIPALERLFSRLPRKPRYVNDAPRTLYELTRIVVDRYDGDASRIWKGRRARHVKETLLSIYGVGPGIANMTLLLIERMYKVSFADLDHSKMDIKPDVHTVRVLYRLGVSGTSTEQSAVEAARVLNPVYPGAVDAALWLIGRKWCHPTWPECNDCILTSYCERRI